jgi:hypothetical protein
MPVILPTWEAEIRRITVSCQPEQKHLQNSISLKKSWAWWCSPVILATAGSLKHKGGYPGLPSQKVRSYLQNNQSKKG